MSGFINGPIPPYNNPPIQPQFYQPKQYFIASIGLGVITYVTTSFPNDFVIGQLVRLVIPPTFGARQLNQASGYVTAIISPTELQLNIDSSQSDPLISSSATTLPQIIPVGDINSGQTNANGISSTLTFIPGSFKNISPA